MKIATLCLFLLPGFLAFGQEAASSSDNPPPAAVDQALRARVTQFYSANVTGKWRDAFQVVADDMQNEYLAAPKDTFNRCETTKITYSENFTKATVLETCHGEYRWHNSRIPTTVPLTSTWKYTDGQWYWYYIKPTEVMTPWGVSRPGPENTASPGASAVSSSVVAVMQNPGLLAKEILSKINVDKSEMRLLGYENSKDELHVSNAMPGTISFSIESSPLPGFHIKPEKAQVGPNESTPVVFEYNLEEAKKQCGACANLAKPRLLVHLRIQPTGQVFTIRVTFGISPQLEKQLPKELRTGPAKQ